MSDAGTPLLAFDIGGTKIAVASAVLGRDGRARYRRVERLATPRTAADALELLLAAARRVSGGPPEGIGVSFGGQVWDTPSGRVSSRHVPGWEGIDLAAVLADHFTAPAVVVNDANAAGRAEYLRAFGTQSRHTLAYLTVSTGIGGAVIIGGRPHPGRHQLAGEVGHLPVGGSARCSCGGRGHLEALASGPAIARRAVARMRARPGEASCLRAGSPVSARDVDRAARRGDPVASAVLADAGALVGGAIATIGLVLDPDLIVIGGGVAQAGAVFWRPLRRAARDNSLCQPSIRRARLGADSALRGAVEFARDAALSERTPAPSPAARPADQRKPDRPHRSTPSARPAARP
ncbi:ROK family protein [Allokutzneria sp. A3M-2-11 16]|uniref:ROK family protein n=1 Tax=Allokutzneria sp. A3M-2-11 16 TaxID=2962043 RepID=UPI0020B841B6|nr:ROK family protein [Allokutzneria sp. A3M-2-11 16]MCP3803235.1 ROK family protein [Allokutzneria sp. A3M-2-11 16]